MWWRLNRHPHFHDLVVDGLFALVDDELVFHEAHIRDDAIPDVQSRVRRRVLRLLARRGCIDSSTLDDMLSWDHDAGFSVDASVLIPAWDRQGLERLVRYCSRPSFSLERLFRLDDGNVGYTPRKPTMDGRPYIVFKPSHLLDAISALIPPPHVNLHSYFGALAPHSRLRRHMTGAGAGAGLEMLLETSARKMGISRPRSAWARMWAMLIARIFEVLPLICQRCGSEMEIVSFHTEAHEIRFLLERAGLDPDPPPVSPARDPPQVALALDQCPLFDDTDQRRDEAGQGADPVDEEPEDLDQSLEAPDYES